MAKKPNVIVLRTAGTNCDQETAFAFKSFGADVSLVHIKRLLKGEVRIKDYHILALPGGFTYGDDIESGRILANELRLFLSEEVSQFIDKGKLIIGICNGFQVLVKSGFLPGNFSAAQSQPLKQEATLIANNSGKFEDRWTYLKVSGNSVWTRGLKDIVYFPVAHAEGKFVTGSAKVLQRLNKNDQVAFRYCTSIGGPAGYPDNPNGSQEDIAGITDKTGNILGLMPHPERHFFFINHPFWTRKERSSTFGDGAKIFENGVNYIKKKFLS